MVGKDDSILREALMEISMDIEIYLYLPLRNLHIVITNSIVSAANRNEFFKGIKFLLMVNRCNHTSQLKVNKLNQKKNALDVSVTTSLRNVHNAHGGRQHPQRRSKI